MGLTIFAFEKARLGYSKKQCKNSQCFLVRPSDRFHKDRIDGFKKGYYRATGRTMSFDARCHSMSFLDGYGAYNHWRGLLSLLIFGVKPEEVWNNRSKYAGRPFVELIDMSDCEGAIGPKTSMKLAKDFEGFGKTLTTRKILRNVRKYGLESEFGHIFTRKCWFRDFLLWQEAFSLASNDGFVVFY